MRAINVVSLVSAYEVTTILLREKVVQVKLNRLRKGTKQCVFILLVNLAFMLY